VRIDEDLLNLLDRKRRTTTRRCLVQLLLLLHYHRRSLRILPHRKMKSLERRHRNRIQVAERQNRNDRNRLASCRQIEPTHRPSSAPFNCATGVGEYSHRKLPEFRRTFPSHLSLYSNRDDTSLRAVNVDNRSARRFTAHQIEQTYLVVILLDFG